MTKTKDKKEKAPEVKAAEKKVEDGGELAVVQPVAVVETEGQPIVPADFKSKLTRAQIEVIKDQYAKGATDVELKMFLYVCQRTGLDPFSKQIHLVPRWDSRLGKEVRGVVIGIDGLRSVAERTGAYAGNSDPYFDGEKEISWTPKDGKKQTMTVPSKATVTVKKVVQGVMCDFTATAEWDEYYPGEKAGIMWRKMPKNMIGKCAEAKALRKAFPAVMSGLYVAEEMHQAQVVAAPEQSDFEKASKMIGMIKDGKGLEDLKGKLEGSKKYTAKEKKELVALVEARIVELKKDHAPETLPVIQSDETAGGQPDDL